MAKRELFSRVAGEGGHPTTAEIPRNARDDRSAKFLRIGFAFAIVACLASTPPDAVASVSRFDADYRRMEREIVDEINSARTNPRAYANAIAELLPYFDGDLLRRPGMTPRQTVEGVVPARQAIDALRGQRPVGAVKVNEGLALAARDHVNDQSRSGQTGHQSSDGTAPDVRADRYGTWAVSYSENIAYGHFSTGADVVLSLIIDDGVPDRGHRRNIFDPSVNVVGVACGPHPRFGTTCVIEHAGLFISETAGAHDRARRNKPMM